MIYPSDLNYYSKAKLDSRHMNNVTILSSNDFLNQYPLKIKYLKSSSGRRSNRKNRNEETMTPKSSELELKSESIWERYCNSSTVHGFKYITDKSLHWSERYAWIFLVFMATMGIIYSTFLIKNEFQSNRLQTVVETTFFPIYEISFPAVTICNYNPVNADHIKSSIDSFLPNGTDESKQNLYSFFKIINSFEYGSFEAIPVQHLNFSSLEHINITALMFNLTYTCEEMFKDDCWWRNQFMSCCSIFEPQRTEYGLCFTFNSVLNSAETQKLFDDTYYPWHTSSYGEWSGLRTQMYVDDALNIRANEEPPGILVVIHDPYEWPSTGTGHFIPTGTEARIAIKPTYSYKTSDVQRLTPEDRDCLYKDEAENSAQYLKLSGLPYLRSNCYSECRKRHMLSKCNCSLDILYPDGDYNHCNISDFKCLLLYSSYFNNYKPVHNKYLPKDEPGILCNCLPQCEYIEYGVEISTMQIATENITDKMRINIDVHFQQATMVKYRTSVEFDWIDLIVSFGGFTGLFLGFSMLSFAEMIFYIIIALISLVKHIKSLELFDRYFIPKSRTE